VILDLVKLLQSAAVGMMDGSVLGAKEGYEQASSVVLGLTLNTLAEGLDSAAESYTEENTAMRAIFREAAEHFDGSDGPLAGRLRAAAASDGSLRLSLLREENLSLRALLIELHAQVEQGDDDRSRTLDERIWAELLCSTERRRVAIGPF
jgi:hypothetical protein